MKTYEADKYVAQTLFHELRLYRYHYKVYVCTKFVPYCFLILWILNYPKLQDTI